MPLHEWFRPPRHLLALFVAVIVLPALALAWLAWRTYQQDKALESQRLRDRLETAASGIAAGLALRLDQLASQLSSPAAAAGISSTDDSVALVVRGGATADFPPGRLLYYPRVPASAAVHDSGLTNAEELEFRRRDPASAANAFRRASRSDHPGVRAAALLGLARCLRKAGRQAEALGAYDDLARLGTFPVEGAPAELVARYARCTLLAETRSAALEPEAAALYADLHARRWAVDRASYQLYSAETRAWLAPAAVRAPGPPILALADAAVEVDRLREHLGGEAGRGRLALWLHGRPLLAVWENTPAQMNAAIVGQSWFRQAESLWGALNVASVLVDHEAHVVAGDAGRLAAPVVVRQAADSGLPWTLRVASADPEAELAVLSARRRVTVAGLVLVGALVLVGGSLVERALARELAAARLQADFVATVSHEFRSPLTSMKHLLEMLEQDAVPSQERRRRYYQVLSGETERLRRLVENLLTFRRMEEQQAEFRFEPTDAGALVGRVASDFAAELPSADRLVVSGDCQGARVDADREALSRALWNLLDNAAKYSPESAPIDVELSADREHLRVSVKDRGAGIPLEERKEIFKKFFRGSGAMKSGVKGTGIGLALVSRIVEGHGGAIEVESEPGKGSVFTIVLPLIPDP